MLREPGTLTTAAANLTTARPLPFSAEYIAPDCTGVNFYDIDPSVQRLVSVYVPDDVRAIVEPHMRRLGALAGGKLDELARTADRHPPVLHARDRYGRDEDWIEYHPVYRDMERIAFGDFQLHAMSHRAGVLGLDKPFPATAKYVFQYLFVQSEFGLSVPINLSDTSVHLISRYGSQELKDYLLPKMLSGDMDKIWKGTQFITEKAAGSDIGRLETRARPDGRHWRITGQKWFCSHTDADVALMLARPEGAPDGTAGLGLFALPRRLEDGSRNSYRIVRLKDKMGTRSMASGEINLDGAVAYLVGEAHNGFKQMMDQVNLSRISHGVRAASMMRRCVNEALAAARHRQAFGGAIIQHPLMRRQLMKMIVPTEQALSFSMLVAHTMDRQKAGANDAAPLVRILTPLVKFRACRDNVKVATAAMESRGGNGYIEEWVTARLVRDAHVGLIWEGTSNVIAIDVVRRALGKSGTGEVLKAYLLNRLNEAQQLPASYRERLEGLIARVFAFAAKVAANGDGERHARLAAGALYNITSAVIMAWESCQKGKDGRRALLGRFIIEHRLETNDPMSPRDDAWEQEAAALILDGRPVPFDQAARLLVT
jgi:alkylation response protein AidB-like acyl-CoA dehydrogenase